MFHNNLLTEEEQERLYLVHHMHHYKNGDDMIHELHHCPLFSEKGMKGEKYSIEHLFVNMKLYHVVDCENNKFLYDHANNTFELAPLEFENQKYFYIK